MDQASRETLRAEEPNVLLSVLVVARSDRPAKITISRGAAGLTLRQVTMNTTKSTSSETPKKIRRDLLVSGFEGVILLEAADRHARRNTLDDFGITHHEHSTDQNVNDAARRRVSARVIGSVDDLFRIEDG